MFVSLYTSRIILNALGVEDYGIYNVVGGVVTMFSLISNSLASAISRFITYELGRDDMECLQRTFSASVTILLLLSIIIIILVETIGIWFLNNHMTISPERLIAANWVFQFSLITFVTNLISVPYNASIIAHERMSAFAYISIIEAIGKLGIAFLITISPVDKLIFYALLMCIVAAVVRFLYGRYCKKHFKECRYHFIWDKTMLSVMSSFAGWSFIGASAGVLRSQGVNVLLNIYFDPLVNAARGVAVQVNNAIANFSNNFLMAINPQIIKSYSQNDIQRSFNLTMCSARFAYLLLCIISTPVVYETDYILKLWLKITPEYAVDFVRLAVILTLAEVVSLPLMTLQQATGNIRNYQIVVGSIYMLNFPLSWIFLYMGFSPSIVYIVAICLAIISLYVRMFMLKRVVPVSLLQFNRDVILRICTVTAFIILTLIFLKNSITNPWEGIILSLIISLTWSILFGIKCKEKKIIIEKIQRIKR